MELFKPMDVYFTKKVHRTYTYDFELMNFKPDSRYINVISIPNQIYYGKINYTGCSRGRSSVTFEYALEDKVYLEMFLSGMDDLIHSGEKTIRNLEGYFTFVKRGMNYGFIFLGSDLKEPKVNLLDLLNKKQQEKENENN